MPREVEYPATGRGKGAHELGIALPQLLRVEATVKEADRRVRTAVTPQLTSEQLLLFVHSLSIYELC